MSRIDSKMRLTPSPAQYSTPAEAIVSARIARATAPDPLVGPSLLIIPVIMALIALGWMVTLLAVLSVLAPVIGLGLCVMDRLTPPNPTDVWHGR